MISCSRLHHTIPGSNVACLLLAFALFAMPCRSQTAAPADAPEVLPEVVVVSHLDDVRNKILPSLGAASYEISSLQIANQSQGEDAPFNQSLLRAPGVVEDSFGQLHVRGEHANIQYRINGVLLPEGIAGFGAELDSRFVDKFSLIDGALPAQYGFKTAGVVDIQSKSGAINPGGEVSFYGGSFGTINPSIQFSGAAGKIEYYFSGSYLRSDLGIENPTPKANAIHDSTSQYRGFLYLSYVIDPSSRRVFSEERRTASIRSRTTRDRFQLLWIKAGLRPPPPI